MLGCALPAWRATRGGRLGFSRAGTGITGHGLGSLRPNRSGGRLVVAELTFALALTAPALLLVRSVARLVTADLGFDTSGVVTLPLSLPVSEYDAAGAASFFARAVEAVARQQGVARAAWVDGLPLTGSFSAQLQRSGSPEQQVTAVVRASARGRSRRWVSQ